MTVFLRVLDIEPDAKAEALRHAISYGCRQPSEDCLKDRLFLREPSSFLDAPGSALLYWLPDSVLSLYGDRTSWDSFETRCGLGTLDDFQFLRGWWELPVSSASWHPFAKGGAFAPWFADIPLSIDWKDEGRILKVSVAQK